MKVSGELTKTNKDYIKKIDELKEQFKENCERLANHNKNLLEEATIWRCCYSSAGILYFYLLVPKDIIDVKKKLIDELLKDKMQLESNNNNRIIIEKILDPYWEDKTYTVKVRFNYKIEKYKIIKEELKGILLKSWSYVACLIIYKCFSLKNFIKCWIKFLIISKNTNDRDYSLIHAEFDEINNKRYFKKKISNENPEFKIRLLNPYREEYIYVFRRIGYEKLIFAADDRISIPPYNKKIDGKYIEIISDTGDLYTLIFKRKNRFLGFVFANIISFFIGLALGGLRGILENG